ncbi:MAG: hypothetical protein ACK42D_04850, partial [Candidatus Paceibacteria bacterium]
MRQEQQHKERTELQALIDHVLKLEDAVEVLRYRSLIDADYELYVRNAKEVLTAHIDTPIPTTNPRTIYIKTREYVEFDLGYPKLAEALDDYVDAFCNYGSLHLIKKAIQKKIDAEYPNIANKPNIKNIVLSKIMNFVKKHYIPNATYDLLLMSPHFLALSTRPEDEKSCFRGINYHHYANILNYPFAIYYGALFRNKKYMGRFWVIKGIDFYVIANPYPEEIIKVDLLKKLFDVPYVRTMQLSQDETGFYINHGNVYVATDIEDESAMEEEVYSFFAYAHPHRFEQCEFCHSLVDLFEVRNEDSPYSLQAHILDRFAIILCEECAKENYSKCAICGKEIVRGVNGKQVSTV